MRFNKLFIYLLLSVSPLTCRRGGTPVPERASERVVVCDTLRYSDGSVAQWVHTVDGVRHGEVASFWQDGTRRAHAEYVNGKVHGTARQWYRSGALFKELNYVHGIEEGVQRAYRENGVLYANYVAKDGRHFGLKRSNLCFQLEDEVVNYNGVRGEKPE